MKMWIDAAVGGDCTRRAGCEHGAETSVAIGVVNVSEPGRSGTDGSTAFRHHLMKPRVGRSNRVVVVFAQQVRDTRARRKLRRVFGRDIEDLVFATNRF